VGEKRVHWFGGKQVIKDVSSRTETNAGEEERDGNARGWLKNALMGMGVLSANRLRKG